MSSQNKYSFESNAGSLYSLCWINILTALCVNMFEFLWSTVCSEAADENVYGCYPLQRVVRHIFIHIGIFYIWITGLFNKLQYSAMYFYIVSSFLFKDRWFFFFFWSYRKCCALKTHLQQNSSRLTELYWTAVHRTTLFVCFIYVTWELSWECPCHSYVLFWPTLQQSLISWIKKKRKTKGYIYLASSWYVYPKKSLNCVLIIQCG